MCGICGERRFDRRATDEPTLAEMRDRLVHRGPDSCGAYRSPDGSAALGFRRLRIIDLTANANQPMPNEDGAVRVVFNGEIYNFRELRDGLLQRGHTFRSRSDTETIAHLFEEKGPDCVDDLDGMFAIAIWDERASRLVLARDRAGKKPLFYYHADGVFAFASEIKAFFGHPDLRIEVDPAAVPYYFIHGYVPGPRTFYTGVFQVAPGTRMTIDADGRIDTRRYWQIEFHKTGRAPEIPRAAAIAGVRERVTRAVEKRLISDVPLGAFLSGGLDSTIVVGVMSRLMAAPVKTFSIGFEGDEAYDETRYARLAAECFGTEHTEFRVAPDAARLIDTLIWHHDGPFGDSSALPTYLVATLARAHVTVALTGDGGDELFAGYRRFRASIAAGRIPGAVVRAADAALSHLPAPRHERSRLADARRFFRAAAAAPDVRMTMWNAVFFDDLAALLRPDFAAHAGQVDPLHYIEAERPRMNGLSPLSRLLHANFTSYLADDLLVKLDRCTMATSLEARSPFLDRELIEYAAALPDRFKLAGSRSKAILRDAFADLVPPEIDRRGKMGFGVPVGSWFRGHLRELLRDLLLAPQARYRSMLSGAYVEQMVARHLEGGANLGPQLWTLICFERWLQLLPEWTRAPRAS
jgi:asparagine synthase (glutamine-hydrolysing)